MIKKNSNVASLLVFGDVGAINQLNQAKPSTSSGGGWFCCTSDYSQKNIDVNLNGIAKPLKQRDSEKPVVHSYWTDEIIHFYIKEGEY